MFFNRTKQTNFFQNLLRIISIAFAFITSSVVAADSPFKVTIVINEIYSHQSDGFIEIKVKDNNLLNTNLDFNLQICSYTISGNGNNATYTPTCLADGDLLNFINVNETYPNESLNSSQASMTDLGLGFALSLYDANGLVVDRIIATGSDKNTDPEMDFSFLPTFSSTSIVVTKNGDKLIRRLPDGDVTQDVISSNADKKQTRGSNNDGVDVATKYKLFFNSQNITCEPLNVEVRACVSVDDCSVFNDIDGNAALQVQTSAGNSFDVNVDANGIGNVQVFHNSAEIVSLSLANEAYECDPADCNVEFVQSILKLTPVNDSTNFNSACGLNRNFILQALQADGSNQCVTLFTDTSKSLSINSSLPGLVFNGEDIAESPIGVDFNSDGDANVTIYYADSGEHIVDFAITETLPEAGDLLIQGTSDLGYYPDYFDVQAMHTDGTSISDLSPEVAGNEFNFSVTAMCANDVAAQSYQASSDYLTLTLNQGINDFNLGEFSLPSATNPITIIDNNAEEVYAPFSDGKYSNLQTQYSEVGNIIVKVEDNYLGQDISTTKTIVRFIPDHFELAIEQSGNLESASCETYTYTGKQFNGGGDIVYGERPMVKITPYSKSRNGIKNITQNYVLRNTSDDFLLVSSASNQHTLGSDNMFLELVSQINNSSSFSTDISEPGITYYRFNGADSFYFNRTNQSLINTFDVEIELMISAFNDDDLVAFSQCDGSEATCSCTSTTCQLALDLAGVSNSFARWKILDTFGPETENLGQIMKVQLYTENAAGVADWLINSTDSCTGFIENELKLVDINDLDISLTSVINRDSSVVTFVNGAVRTLLLSAPGEAGKVGLNYDVPNWFKYDWLQNGSLNQNPSAIATFGRFNNRSKRVISQREIERKN